MAATPLVATQTVLVMYPVAVGSIVTAICAIPPLLVSVPTLKMTLGPMFVYGYDVRPKLTPTNWAVAGIVLVTMTICGAVVRLVTVMVKVRLLLIPTGLAEAVTLSHMPCASTRQTATINPSTSSVNIRKLEKIFIFKRRNKCVSELKQR